MILRCDSGDDLCESFRAAFHDIVEIRRRGPIRVKIDERTFQAIYPNSFGQYAGI